MLRARRDLHLGDDAAQPRLFTAGAVYRVVRMHPVANPPCVVVLDDQGKENFLHGEHIRDWFVQLNRE